MRSWGPLRDLRRPHRRARRPQTGRKVTPARIRVKPGAFFGLGRGSAVCHKLPGLVNQVSTNIRWHHAAVSADDREALLGQRGAVVWLTGLSGAGKSTIAARVDQALHARGRVSYILDGDNLRFGLCADLGFGEADRAENVRRLGEAARLLQDAGLIVLVAAISPYRRDRERVRGRIAAGRFIEVFVDAPLAVCEARDPKGLYRKARAGEITGFSGIDAPYEPPEAPELRLVADPGATPESHAAAIVAELATRGLLAAP